MSISELVSSRRRAPIARMARRHRRSCRAGRRNFPAQLSVAPMARSARSERRGRPGPHDHPVRSRMPIRTAARRRRCGAGPGLFRIKPQGKHGAAAEDIPVRQFRNQCRIEQAVEDMRPAGHRPASFGAVAMMVMMRRAGRVDRSSEKIDAGGSPARNCRRQQGLVRAAGSSKGLRN